MPKAAPTRTYSSENPEAKKVNIIGDYTNYSPYGMYISAVTYSNVNQFTGSSLHDALYGWDGNDTLYGLAGDDIIEGGGHNDIISGGSGDDWLYGDYDNESSSANGSDTIHGGLGNDYIFGGGGNDILNGDQNNDEIEGGDGNDEIEGGDGNDILIGGIGFDTIDGDGGNDDIYDDDYDTFSGNREYINGGGGIDTLYFINRANTDWITIVHLEDQFGNIRDIQNSTTYASETILNIENVSGSQTTDWIWGDSNNNILEGNGGNDELHGGSGNDGLYGGDGDDRLYGGSGADTLDGGTGFDVVDYSERSSFNMETEGDILISIEGILGSSGNDIFVGGSDSQIFVGGAGSNTISYKNDTTGVTIDLAAQTVSGGHAEGDTIYNFSNATGGSGDDTIFANADANILSAGLGNDAIAYAYDTVGVDVNLETQTAGTANNGAVNALAISHAEGDIISGFERAGGGSGDDILTGSSEDNTLLGLAGHDTLDGGLGIDTVWGNEGDDIIIAHADGDTLDGGEGGDTLDYSASNKRFHIDLGLEDKTTASAWYRSTGQVSSSGNATAADYDTISGFEHVKLGSGHDYIEGSGTADNAIDNHIWGGNGNDHIYGKYGDDILHGDAGEDIIRAGQGNDLVYGGADLDGLFGHNGNDIVFGDAGDDKIWGNNDDDILYGNLGNDELYGGRGIDTLYGNEGHDYIAGYDGDDTLYGGSGDDELYGQAGADTYYGGAGKDYMYSGGADGAKDTFIFEDASESVGGAVDNRDRIVGFETGIDEINLAALSIQSASIIQVDAGAGIYLVNDGGNTDFEIVVTTTGGTLTASDIVV